MKRVVMPKMGMGEEHHLYVNLSREYPTPVSKTWVNTASKLVKPFLNTYSAIRIAAYEKAFKE